MCQTNIFLRFHINLSEYPDGSTVLCTGPFCSEECRTQGCPTLIESTTCAQIRFCYTKDSGSDVWQLPSENALANCDFSEATLVCATDEGDGEDCCNYVVEDGAENGPRFFASKQGCEQSQRAAVNVVDYEVTGDQCFGMGLTSSRINKCTCKLATTLVEPCHSEFVQGCLTHAPDIADDDECCATSTCVGKHQDIDDPIGRNIEKSRKLLCNDAIPGLCAVNGVSDCCTKTCSECGIDLDPFAKWSTCTSGDSATNSGTCGSQSPYYYSPRTCDFAACDTDHAWHPEMKAAKCWLQAVDPQEGDTSLDCTDTLPKKKLFLHGKYSIDKSCKTVEKKGICTGDCSFTKSFTKRKGKKRCNVRSNTSCDCVCETKSDELIHPTCPSLAVPSSEREKQICNPLKAFDFTNKVSRDTCSDNCKLSTLCAAYQYDDQGKTCLLTTSADKANESYKGSNCMVFDGTFDGISYFEKWKGNICDPSAIIKFYHKPSSKVGRKKCQKKCLKSSDCVAYQTGDGKCFLFNERYHLDEEIEFPGVSCFTK